MRATVAVALPLLVLTAACSGTPSASVSTATVTARTTATATATVTTTSTPSASTTSSASPGTRCTSAHLAVTLGPTDGAAGSVYQPIVFTNKGSGSCTLAGHPGVSFVAGGAQVGKAASHASTPPTTTVTLKPGGAASALLRTVDYGVFTPSDCVAKTVSGLRVYPPGSTASVVLALPSGSKACSAKAAQLTVGAVVKGSTGS